MRLHKQKRGQIMIFITFLILAMLLILIASVLIPMGVLFSVTMYEAGEQLYLDTNETLTDISDDEVRAGIQASLDSGLDSLDTNIDVMTDIFQYSWIIVLVLTALVLFIFTRRLVETTQGGGII